MNTRLVSLILICLTGLTGCDSVTAVDAEIDKWTREGWQYVETIGTPSKGSEYISHMSSPTASMLTAFATSSTGPIKQDYPQTERIYLVVTMGNDLRNTLSLVFSKPKPSSADSP